MQILENEIGATNWSLFNGPVSYKAHDVPSALYQLISLDSAKYAEEVGYRLINAIGNNHAGVYYPAVLKALDYIIYIEKNTEHKACKVCALSVLNDIFYFSPEIGDYKGCSNMELEKFVTTKLCPYSDENIRF